jgi:enamine deaminase RidA (YjgF/YER057c/UK114 family)
MARRIAHSGSPYEERYGFARGVRIGNRVEIAGTAPIPPVGEPLVPTAFGQMLRCGAIAVAALEELGATTSDVVRTRMFITDPEDADDIGRAHREIFGAAHPAATMIVVAALLDPAWRVELEVEAVVSD